MTTRKKTLLGLAVGLPIVAALCLYFWYRHLVPVYMRDIGMSLIQRELFNRVCICTAVVVAVAERFIYLRLVNNDSSDSSSKISES